MRLDAYRQVLTLPGLRPAMLFSLLAKIPVVSIPLVLTLHITLGKHLGFAEAGIVLGMWTIGVAVGAPVQGRCIDRGGLRPLFMVATVGQALFWGLAPQLSFRELACAGLLSGLVLVPGTTISRIAIAGLVPKERQHTAFVVDSMLTNLSYMSAPALGVLIATQVSTAVALWGIGLLLVLGGIAVIVFNPPLEARNTARSAGEQPAVRQWLRGGLLAALACAFAAGTISSGSEIVVVGRLKQLDAVAWMSAVAVLYGASSIAGGMVYGGLRRSPPAPQFVIALGALTMPLGLIGNPLWFGLALVPAALLYAPAFAATAAAASEYAVAGANASVMGLYSVAVTVGTAVGGPIAGEVLDRASPAWAFLAVGALAVLIPTITLCRGLGRGRPAPAAQAAGIPSQNIDTRSH